MGWMQRVRALFRRKHLSADLDEELQFHLAMREQLSAQEGMPQEEARSDAMRRFGNPGRWKEKMREIDVFTLPETVWQDVRFAARMLAKHRGFTGVAIFALGLGIGVNTAIFTVYKSFLLRPLDASDTRQMVNVDRTDYQGKYDRQLQLCRLRSVPGPQPRIFRIDCCHRRSSCTFGGRQRARCRRFDGRAFGECRWISATRRGVRRR